LNAERTIAAKITDGIIIPAAALGLLTLLLTSP
jgi:hypothetical protein